jgi:hypothetical protein
LKTLLLTFITFLTLNGISQNIPPVTNAEINEINLKLDGLEKFGKQHRKGNHLLIAGTILNGFGLLFMSSTTTTNPNATFKGDKLAIGTLAVGTILSTTGLIINLDSYRHLRKKG